MPLAHAGSRRRAAGTPGLNAKLIRMAGPAAVGPYETTPPPSVAERAERACPLCGAPMTAHTFDRSGPKPLMHCP